MFMREDDVWYETFTQLLRAGGSVENALNGANAAAEGFLRRFPDKSYNNYDKDKGAEDNDGQENP